jgi:alpha-beta hydrolase superfamily lysophospholipase
MGAAAVLRAVDMHRLDADALILEAPFDRLLTTTEHRFHELGAPAFPAARLLLFWGGVQQGVDALSFAPVEHARAVAMPTLMMIGERDPYVSVEEAKSVLANLRGPRRLQVFPGLPHRSLATADPTRWVSVVREFLDSVPGERATARAGSAGDAPAKDGHNVACPPFHPTPRRR